MTLETLAKTPLHAAHRRAGARMAEFAGWSMPITYGSIVAEHGAVRSAAGMFDVSHMTRLRVVGADAASLLDRALTRRASDLRPGRHRYCLICNSAGGAIDDVLVSRPSGEASDDEPELHVVANASNRASVIAHLTELGEGMAARLVDETDATAMIAVQGPLAVDRVAELAGDALRTLRNYRGTAVAMDGVACFASRTGYTGEDGFELITPASIAEAVWQRLAEAGVAPCGLASRDLLRTEAAMPLYGHELTDAITPLEAGLGFAVDLDGADFVGRAAILAVAESGVGRRRIGIALPGKRAAREGCTVLAAGQSIGAVTSGVYSPSLQAPIAMALVDRDIAVGESLQVDLRGTLTDATAVALPFYRR